MVLEEVWIILGEIFFDADLIWHYSSGNSHSDG
jgi:hypothetical protein